MTTTNTKTLTLAQRAAELAERIIREQRATILRKWGIAMTVNTEADALLLAYAYRSNRHGYKIEENAAAGTFLVTIFSAKAAGMKLDGAF